MKSYIEAIKVFAIVFSALLGLLVFPYVLNLLLEQALDYPRLILIAVLATLTALFWSLHWRLVHQKPFAFVVSFSFLSIIWLLLAAQSIRRISFIIANNGMDTADSGSPAAFLAGFLIEQFLFLPLTVAMYTGAMHWLKSRKAQ